MTESYIFSPPTIASLPIKGETARYPVHRIFCVGRNYADHAREMGFDVEKVEPFFFDKPTAYLCQSGQTISYPPGTEDFHHEVEMVVALHSGGNNISEDQAMKCVYGYASALDMTRRDLQQKFRKEGKPWDLGKGFENSAIIGSITKKEDFGDVKQQAITLKVNGELRQNADVGLLIFTIPELIAYLSKFYTLQAGDLLYTGTPAGVSAIQRGDTLVGRVDGCDDVSVRYV